MQSAFKMCSASLHLLIGALLVLAVESEDTTMLNSTGTTTALVSMSIDNTTTTTLNETSDNFPNNFTTSFPPNSTVILSSTTYKNTSDYTSDSPTPHPSKYTQTNNDITGNPEENVPQASTNIIKRTTSKITTTQAVEPTKSQGLTYVIILIIAVVCISGVVLYCCAQKKSRKYSVDLHPKQEDTQIPLSTVDAEVFDTTSVKDIQTFTSAESTEPLKDPDPVKETEKPEEGKESAGVKQENQQNASSTQATVIPKDKTAELTVVDMTDGETTISTKTSMESLDDALNENNSNNTRTEADERPSSAFQYKMPHDI